MSAIQFLATCSMYEHHSNNLICIHFILNDVVIIEIA